MSVRRAKGMTSLDFHDMYITDLQTHDKSSLFGKCGVLESISWFSWGKDRAGLLQICL